MDYQYKRDQDEFFRTMQDLEDNENRRERKQRAQRLQILADGLTTSLHSLSVFKQAGFDTVADRAAILSVWKKSIPEVWGVPEAKPLIDMIFPDASK